MAPRRSVKLGKINNNSGYKNLSVNDVLCPICRGILIKPITLPCTHGFCSSCFEGTMQNSNLVCPLCRVRIGSWLRSATKTNNFVNEALWKAIQVRFPLQIRNKLDEKSNGVLQAKNHDLVNKLKDGGEFQLALKDDKANFCENGPSTSTRNNQNIDKCSVLINNFANKEYTCRILCQNLSKEPLNKQHINSEILRKNKQIQKITQNEDPDTDRSDSIESECLYFKPIDYRHNPPSECLPPIKVPTKRPQPNNHAKIKAPSGQTEIKTSFLESAFARLLSSVAKKPLPPPAPPSGKRKTVEMSVKSKKKRLCDNRLIEGNKLNLIKEESKKLVQEKSDYEFARKLQEELNRTSKYLTRSSSYRNSTRRQVKIGEIMQKTSYKVK